eukprot:TRINITY_DN65331_c0_g1_i1.p1 TRINITY_DN65331_c0_g1~~TRINITY_DN65331_c0_g1_i1.p1  ORF type:complete len:335 (+),score=35.08 TRINITY_DN65331_c0_g1_i1:137-1141(+)
MHSPSPPQLVTPGAAPRRSLHSGSPLGSPCSSVGRSPAAGAAGQRESTPQGTPSTVGGASSSAPLPPSPSAPPPVISASVRRARAVSPRTMPGRSGRLPQSGDRVVTRNASPAQSSSPQYDLAADWLLAISQHELAWDRPSGRSPLASPQAAEPTFFCPRPPSSAAPSAGSRPPSQLARTLPAPRVGALAASPRSLPPLAAAGPRAPAERAAPRRSHCWGSPAPPGAVLVACAPERDESPEPRESERQFLGAMRALIDAGACDELQDVGVSDGSLASPCSPLQDLTSGPPSPGAYKISLPANNSNWRSDAAELQLSSVRSGTHLDDILGKGAEG